MERSYSRAAQLLIDLVHRDFKATLVVGMHFFFWDIVYLALGLTKSAGASFVESVRLVNLTTNGSSSF